MGRAGEKNRGAAATSSAAAPDKVAFVAFRAFDAHGDWPGVLALRISLATDKFAEAAVFFHQVGFAGRALFVQRLIRLPRDARAFHQAPGGLAIRIAGAGQENTEAAALDGHFLAAIIAIFDFAVGFAAPQLRRKGLNKITI